MIFDKNINPNDYFIATYELESVPSLKEGAWDLAIGQSVGNPNVRNKWETDDLFKTYSVKIMADESELTTQRGIVKFAFPIINTNWKEDGISHLMCQLMGGQLDIDKIKYCRLLKLEFPKEVEDHFLGPKHGLKGFRDYVGVYDKPLLGAIVKPKTGISPQVLLEMVKELVDGGVNFIKEDEILSNPIFCPIEVRVPLIMDYIKKSGKKVIYAVCINSDYPYVIDRVKKVYELGGNAVHINFWNGLGVYNSIRKLDLPIFMHFQKSGDKILTDINHRFSIDFTIMCQLAGMMGVDFMHAGMWGGYSTMEEKELHDIMDMLHRYNVTPALSCGMHPGIVNAIKKRFGCDFMANVGGAIHGHPNGTYNGVVAMRSAIDQNFECEQYKLAITKWGLIN
jgi:ribulose 1,5-bisphosphate carboxylase large subunit-like protein